MPADATGLELDRDVQAELRSLRNDIATAVARHLVAAGRIIDEDPERAYQHALAARRLAPRVASVREAVGLAAYYTDRFPEALRELRTARRISGRDDNWPAMADCERALGRPDRALAMAAAPEAARLDTAGKAEMRIVAAGARRDLGQLDAAVVTLHVPELRAITDEPWLARLRYAYADALRAAGRVEEAQRWLRLAAEADASGATDAADRLGEEEVRFLDLDGG